MDGGITVKWEFDVLKVPKCWAWRDLSLKKNSFVLVLGGVTEHHISCTVPLQQGHDTVRKKEFGRQHS